MLQWFQARQKLSTSSDGKFSAFSSGGKISSRNSAVSGNSYCEKVISQAQSSGSDGNSDNHNTSTVGNSSGGGANSSSISVVGQHFDAMHPAALASLLSSTLHLKRGNKKTSNMQAGGGVSVAGGFLNAEWHLQPCGLPCCLKKRKKQSTCDISGSVSVLGAVSSGKIWLIVGSCCHHHKVFENKTNNHSTNNDGNYNDKVSSNNNASNGASTINTTNNTNNNGASANNTNDGASNDANATTTNLTPLLPFDCSHSRPISCAIALATMKKLPPLHLTALQNLAPT